MVSIIIVHYHVKKELFNCLKSIYQSDEKVLYEVIVVDNDERETIYKEIKKDLPQVHYIKSAKNIGYGAGNNLGAKKAKGKYLFFLNPDTEVFPGTIDTLVNFLEKNSDVAIVSPIFLNKNYKTYPLQGSKKLTPLRAIFTLSFLHKLLSNNRIAKEYLLSNWNKADIKEVDVVPGTGFVIRRKIFEQIGGFDKKFFLYFEEFDLCNQVKKLGYKIFIIPTAKVKHIWEASTRTANFDIKKVFNQSRFYYFKKHYGLFPAFIVEVFTRCNKIHLLLGFILTLATFLRLYRLQELMPFIGDQGWFYLSARDILLTGNIPLVGITSSHTWLHQGPLWTYMLSIVLGLFNFNPISGAYFTVVLGIISVLLVYVVGTEMFSKRVGLISAMLYAISPLIIIHSRTPYHTSPIPFFTLLFILSLFKWIKGNIYFFPLSIFFISILYNFELATAVLWFVFMLLISYGVWKKKLWAQKIFTRKILVLSIVAFLTPMLPMILYDITHGFPQTVKFIIWIGYRVVSNNFDLTSFNSMISFFALFYNRLLFPQNVIVASAIFIFSFGWFLGYLYKGALRNSLTLPYVFLLLFIAIPLIGFFVNRAPSEAYLPIFFPGVIIVTALFFNRLIKLKLLQIIGIASLFLIAATNSYHLISHKYFFGQTGIAFKDRLSIAEQIVKEANGRKYNLVGKGEGSKFESFTMNYEYLTWWLGHPPSKNLEKLQYIIEENINGVYLKERK